MEKEDQSKKSLELHKMCTKLSLNNVLWNCLLKKNHSLQQNQLDSPNFGLVGWKKAQFPDLQVMRHCGSDNGVKKV
jgi:hypothetical protein